MKLTVNTAGHPADALGRLLAVKADIAAEEKRLREALLRLTGEGGGAVEGASYRATVSLIEGGQYFEAATAKLFLTDAQVAHCMKEKAPHYRFKATARQADARIGEVA